jgi:hypothetical protein
MNTRLLSYDVPESLINKLKDKLFNTLTEMGYSPERVMFDSHITIAQIKGDPSMEELEKAQQEGKKYKASFKMDYIDYLEGRENLGYVVIKLSPSSGAEKYYNYISNIFDVVTYPGGHKPHISLLTLEKNVLKKEDLEALKKISVSGTITPSKIQLWGSDKKILKEIIAERIKMKKSKKKTGSGLLDTERKVYSHKAPINVVSLTGIAIKASTVKEKRYIADKIITASAILKSNASSKEKLTNLEKIISDLEKTLTA